MTHECHWPSCKLAVPPRMWGCRKHWFLLPQEIRDAIWTAYVPGQELRKDPTDAYLEAAERAREWALEYERKHGVVPGGFR